MSRKASCSPHNIPRLLRAAPFQKEGNQFQNIYTASTPNLSAPPWLDGFSLGEVHSVIPAEGPPETPLVQKAMTLSYAVGS